VSAWTEPPTLSGEHVTLRPLEPDDAPALVEVLAPLAGQFTTGVPISPDDDWFARVWAETAAYRTMAFAVLDSKGAIAGTTRFMRMAEGHRRVEIGGTIYAPHVQRTGLNTEAKRMLLAHAFDTLGCHVVQLRTDWLNHRSRVAIERLGAKLDGVLRGHLVMADGHIRDSVVYSIIASEWPGVRANLDDRLARYKE
jgi:RimJ/RimL family protein N-acetyltransferase